MGLFELSEINIRYDGHDVLKDVSLRIEQGERVSLVGKRGRESRIRCKGKNKSFTID